MIIKVKNLNPVYTRGRFTWVVIDGINHVEFDPTPMKLKDAREIKDSARSVMYYTDPDKSDENDFVCILNYYLKEVYNRIVFNTEAYLCNDEGKTIEKLFRPI